MPNLFYKINHLLIHSPIDALLLLQSYKNMLKYKHEQFLGTKSYARPDFFPKSRVGRTCASSHSPANHSSGTSGEARRTRDHFAYSHRIS